MRAPVNSLIASLILLLNIYDIAGSKNESSDFIECNSNKYYLKINVSEIKLNKHKISVGNATVLINDDSKKIKIYVESVYNKGEPINCTPRLITNDPLWFFYVYQDYDINDKNCVVDSICRKVNEKRIQELHEKNKAFISQTLEYGKNFLEKLYKKLYEVNPCDSA